MSSRQPGPFFVVGAPRTGTTLIRRLLSNHSRVAIPPESGFLIDYLEAERVPLDQKKQLLCEEPELAYWELQPTGEELAPFESTAACIDFLHRKYAGQRGKDVWGQKTPKMVRATDLLSAEFPDARFVHVVRDGRAVALSLNQSKAHRLHVRYGARRYANDARLGLELERRHPHRTHRVRYEDLMTDPERVLRSLCEFLGLEYEATMLDTGTEAVQLTPQEQEAGHHVNVEQPIDPSFVDKWRDGLSPTELQMIEHEAGAVMKELGYSLEAAGPPSPVELTTASLSHTGWVLQRTVRELTRRPDVWQVARRRLKLGSFRRMLGEHLRGM